MNEIGFLEITVLLCIVICITNVFRIFSLQTLSLLNMILIVQGLSSIFLQDKVPFYVGFTMIIFSGYFFVKNQIFFKLNKSLSDYIFTTLTFPVWKNYFFIIFGILMILSDLVINFLREDNLGRYDILIIVNGLIWISYNFIPNSFNQEKNFLFLFSNILIILLIVPSLLYTILLKSSSSNFESKILYYLLSKPLVNLLNLTGYEAFTSYDIISKEGTIGWGTVRYKNFDGSSSQVYIATMCSGIYSIYIFVSAYISFILTEFKSWNRNFSFALFFGLVTAYISNIFRMYIIVLAGHYWGDEALQWTHTYAGWFIFTIWIFLFWNIIFKYFLNK